MHTNFEVRVISERAGLFSVCACMCIRGKGAGVVVVVG